MLKYMIPLCCVLTLFIGTPASAVVAEVAVAEVQAAFDQAAVEHAAGASGGVEPWGLVGYARNSDNSRARVLNRAAALDALVATVRQYEREGDEVQVVAYCRAAGSFLTAPQATHRAVACEFLACFPSAAVEADALPQMGALLADTAAAFPGGEYPITQIAMAPVKITPITMTVGEIAGDALFSMTKIRFADRTVFDRWWTVNGDYSQRHWYWVLRFNAAGYASTRWKLIPRINSSTEPASSVNLHETEKNDVLLAALTPERALQVLLLANNRAAFWHEVQAPWLASGQQPVEMDGGISYTGLRPDPALIVQHVRTYDQRQLLWDVLEGKVVWPEMANADASSQEMLGMAIVDVLQEMLRLGDVATIERILTNDAGLPVQSARLQSRLTLIATHLDAARSEAIIVKQLQRNPAQVELAIMLLQQTGFAHWEVVRTSYDALPPSGQNALIGEIGAVKLPESRATLATLFAEKLLEAVLKDGATPQAADYPRPDRLRAFAAAAASLNGAPVVDDTLLNTATRYPGKVQLTAEERQAYMTAMANARVEVIGILRAFFTNGTP